MRYLFPAMVISLLFVYCKSQRVNGVRLNKYTRETLELVKKEARREIDISCHMDEKMTVYADSLNLLPANSPLPAFIYNERFDVYKLCWPGLHHPISLRQIVVNKVTNKSVIERILKDDNPLLRKICDYDEFELPEIEKSWYELFRLRYAELK
jgi:hypothetical protein